MFVHSLRNTREFSGGESSFWFFKSFKHIPVLYVCKLCSINTNSYISLHTIFVEKTLVLTMCCYESDKLIGKFF